MSGDVYGVFAWKKRNGACCSVARTAQLLVCTAAARSRLSANDRVECDVPSCAYGAARRERSSLISCMQRATALSDHMSRRIAVLAKGSCQIRQAEVAYSHSIREERAEPRLPTWSPPRKRHSKDLARSQLGGFSLDCDVPDITQATIIHVEAYRITRKGKAESRL